MTILLTEGYYNGGFLLSEAPGARSRDAGTFYFAGSTAAFVDAGTVVAKNTVGTATSAAKSGGNTGTGTLVLDATTPVLAGAKVGVYAVRCITAATNGGTFRIEDPDGFVLGDLVLPGSAGGSATWNNDDLKFVITDATTDFIVGDGFDITVAAGDGKWIPFVNGATQTRLGVLFNRLYCAATSNNAATIVTDAAEVNLAELRWDSSLSGGALTTAKAAATTLLGNVGIKLR
jgi:hypothetical protein